MKLINHLMAALLALMILCSPAGSRAASDTAQTSAEQTTQATNQDSLNTEEENAAAAVPELYIPDKSYQFENVPAGQTVTHDFILYNKGTAPLHITRVKTG